MGVTGKAVGKRVLSIVVAIMAFIAVKAIKEWWLESRSQQAAVASVNQELQAMQARAAMKHPDLPSAAALQEEARANIQAKLNSEASDRKKQRATAADQFVGYLFMNTRARVSYCRERGVDISSFKSEFEAVNMNEIKKASQILSAQATELGRDANKDLETLYSMLRPTFQGPLDDDMRAIAARFGTDVTGACRIIGENAKAVAAEMQLAKMHPAMDKVLLGE